MGRSSSTHPKTQRKSCWLRRQRAVTRTRELNMSRRMLSKAGVLVIAFLVAGAAALVDARGGGSGGGGGHASRGGARTSVSSGGGNRSANVNRSADVNRNTT